MIFTYIIPLKFPDQPTPTPPSGKFVLRHGIKSETWLLAEFSISRYILDFNYINNGIYLSMDKEEVDSARPQNTMDPLVPSLSNYVHQELLSYKEQKTIQSSLIITYVSHNKKFKGRSVSTGHFIGLDSASLRLF